MLDAFDPGDIVTVTRIDRLGRSTSTCSPLSSRSWTPRRNSARWRAVGRQRRQHRALDARRIGGLADVECDLIRARTGATCRRTIPVLVTPIIAAVARQMVEDLWREYGDLFILDGAGWFRTTGSLLWLGRFSLITAVLAGFRRAAAEVGAILIVGGNIAGVTRTMTTAIALETSRGDLSLALGLGIILLSLILAINATAQFVRNTGGRAAAA